MGSQSAKLSHIAGLDGLRALAIIAVLFCHANIGRNMFPPPGHWPEKIFTSLAGAGWVGVDLFFVLSGFLITRILFTTKGQPHYFRNFYARRTLRIAPLYYFYVCLVLFVLPRLGGVLHSGYWNQRHLWDRASVLFYFTNFRVAMVGHHLSLLNQLWSLAVEEHFYLVWPFVVASFSGKRLMQIALAGCAVSLACRVAVLAAGFSILAPYVLTPCRLDGLLLGSCVALAQPNPRIWSRVQRAAPFLCAGSFLFLSAIAAYQGHFYDFVAPGQVPGVNSSIPVLSAGLSLLAIFFASLLVIVLTNRKLAHWLETPPLRKLGIYSYGIYMYHMLVIALGMTIIGQYDAQSHLPPLVLKLLLTLFLLIVTPTIAALSYRYFESPILRLKTLFPEQREKAPAERSLVVAVSACE